jgi:hypothetical protein
VWTCNIIPLGVPGTLVQDREPGTRHLVVIYYQNRLPPGSSCLSGGYSTAYPDLIPVYLGTVGNPLTARWGQPPDLKIKSLAYTP